MRGAYCYMLRLLYLTICETRIVIRASYTLPAPPHLLPQPPDPTPRVHLVPHQPRSRPLPRSLIPAAARLPRPGAAATGRPPRPGRALLLVPVAAARLVLFGLAIVVGYAATWVALRGWTDSRERPREGAGPMPAWRRRLIWVTRISARCILFSFGYHWIKRKGNPAPRELAPIVVSNHVSYIDPIYFFYKLFPTIVSSDSHDSIPFVGTIIRAMQLGSIGGANEEEPTRRSW